MERENEKNKEAYEAPVIEMVEVKAEQGVQMSPPGPGEPDDGGTW